MFTNQIIVITGAASGIGQAIALAFAEKGAKLALLDIDEKGLATTQTQLKTTQAEVQTFPIDVSQRKQVDKVFQQIINDYGTIDILVNSAAKHAGQSYFNTTEDILDQLFAVNLKGTFFTCRAVTDYWIKEKKPGRIVNFSSIAGRVVMPYNLPYALSKSAVIHLTKIMALELGKHNINVNVICPGLVDTPMAQAFLSKPELLKSDLERIPMGKIQTTRDCAQATLFLASDGANQITGEVIGVDGGWHIGHP
ncbi:MAG: SDR family NAD(P)-dependent oxidoreductase [Candidatus Ranarchaeia archaeon]|jgi:NAD(P)-dependent dehydrogenase (short-subunit alcohol dehydrogenase family)